MSLKNYRIETVNQSHMSILVEWAKREGWNPGLHDAECFYQADPSGFFIGKLGDEIISCGSAVCYDDLFAFCGFYEVLFNSVVNQIAGESIILDIPEPNVKAKKLVDSKLMKPVFKAERMYLRYDPKLELNRIYGITSFELG